MAGTSISFFIFGTITQKLQSKLPISGRRILPHDDAE
jgi:hypothetical protein